MKKVIGLLFLPAENSEFFGLMPAFVASAVFGLVNGKIVEIDYFGKLEEV